MSKGGIIMSRHHRVETRPGRSHLLSERIRPLRDLVLWETVGSLYTPDCGTRWGRELIDVGVCRTAPKGRGTIPGKGRVSRDTVTGRISRMGSSQVVRDRDQTGRFFLSTDET